MPINLIDDFPEIVDFGSARRTTDRFKNANEMRVALGMNKVRPPVLVVRQRCVLSQWLTWGLLICSFGFLLWSLYGFLIAAGS
jgi:hypothetical protein